MPLADKAEKPGFNLPEYRQELIRSATVNNPFKGQAYDKYAQDSVNYLPDSAVAALLSDASLTDDDVAGFVNVWQAKWVQRRTEEDTKIRLTTPDQFLNMDPSQAEQFLSDPARTERTRMQSAETQVRLEEMGIIPKGSVTWLTDEALERVNTAFLGVKHFLDRVTTTVGLINQDVYGDKPHTLGVDSLGRFVSDLGDFSKYWDEANKEGVRRSFGKNFVDALPGVESDSDLGKALSFATEFYAMGKLAKVYDPLVIASGVRQGLAAVDEVARVNPGYRAKLVQSRPVQAAAKAFAQTRSTGTTDRMLRSLGIKAPPKLLKTLARAETPEEVTKIFDEALASGDVRKLPRLWSDARGEAQVNRMLRQKPGRIFRPLAQDVYDLDSAHAVEQVRALANMGGMSAAETDELVQSYVDASFGAKGFVLEAAAKKSLARLGYSEEALREAGVRTDSMFGQYRARRAYGAGVLDVPVEDVPFFHGELQRYWQAPRYREILSARRAMIGKGLGGYDTFEKAVNEATSHVKVAWLARPAFAFRVALDEMVSQAALFRGSPRRYMQHVSTAWVEDFNHSRNKVARGAGKAIESTARTLGKLPGFGGLAPLAEEQVPTRPLRVTMEAHKRSFRDLYERPAYVTELEQRAVEELALVGKEFDPAEWVYHHPQDVGHMPSWFNAANNHVLPDEVAGRWIQHYDDPVAARAEIDEFLASDAGKAYLEDMGPSIEAVGGVEAFIQAQKEIAFRIIPEELRPAAALIGQLGLDDLLSVAESRRPVAWGYQVVPKGAQSVIAETVRHWEDRAFGPVTHFVDNMVRVPRWRLLYEQEYNTLTESAAQMGRTVSEDELAFRAARAATEQMMPVMHNPAVRTMADVYLRTYMPFGFAYLQFMKRWGRVFIENPGAVRKFQIMMAVGTDTGFFDTDEHGNTSFHIPVAGPVASWVAEHGFGAPKHFFDEFFRVHIASGEKEPDPSGGFLTAFGKVALPPGLPFAAHTMPGWGPVLTIPAALIRTTIPGVEEVRKFILGSQAAVPPGEGWAQKVLGEVAPAWFDKITTALSGDDGDRQWANANKDILSWMIANGKNPVKNKKDEKRARELTKGWFFLRGLFQAFSPWTPTPGLPGSDLRDELHKLQDEFGREQGFDEFISRHGDEVAALGTGKSEARVGKYSMNASPEVEQFRADHPKFIASYPDVAGLLIPQGTYSRESYEAQIASGFRKILSPHDWLMKFARQQGDAWYYDRVRPEYEKRFAAAKTKAKKQEVRDWLAAQQVRIDTILPGWLDVHRSEFTNPAERLERVNQLQAAVADPEIRDTADAQAVRQVLGFYNQGWAKVRAAGYKSWRARSAEPVKRWLVGKYHEVQDSSESGVLDNVWRSLFRSMIEDFEED